MSIPRPISPPHPARGRLLRALVAFHAFPVIVAALLSGGWAAGQTRPGRAPTREAPGARAAGASRDPARVAQPPALAPAPVPAPRAWDPWVIRGAKQVFRAEGVPEEFAWIAVVESSLNPRARSRAGAVGLYQLMPATARELGLRVDRRVDERYDIERNTRAAARYLRLLHARFGSWQLALAAYNAGPTRVARLLRAHSARSYGAIARHLPRETRDYVPKVFAAISRNEGHGHAAATPAVRATDPRTLVLGLSPDTAL